MRVLDHVARVAEVRAGDAPAKVGYPIGLRELEVVRTAALGSAMLRITLGGPGGEGFESHVPEEHVRLVFPDEQGVLRLPERDGPSLRWPRPMPVSREYTVRRHDPVAGEVDIDLALHPGGVASDWAVAARPGDRVHVAGPPGGFVLPDGYDRYVFGGDLTAVPQIARWLEFLPADAVGWAFCEVVDASEEFELTAPAGIRVVWLHRGAVAAGDSDLLVRAVQDVPPSAGSRTLVWVAGEAGAVKPLRRWVRERGLDRRDCRITGYWKRGVADFDDED